MNIPTIEDHKFLVERALDEYESAVNEAEIWIAEYKLRQLGLGPDGFPLKAE